MHLANSVQVARFCGDAGPLLRKYPFDTSSKVDASLEELNAVIRPIFVPISNKKVIGAVTGAVAKQRLAGTAAAMAICRMKGASIFRVHNVKFLARALAMADAIVAGQPAEWFEVVK